jgi:carboxylate-amine ligase
MSIEFHPSDTPSVGMEMEFQLVDSSSFALVDGVMPLLELYPDHTHVKSEFIQTTIEVASKPCQNVSELEEHMRELVWDLAKRSETLGLRLCGAGTHPFSQDLALITPLPRYLAMEKAFGLISHTQITFATHVHVGVHSGDEAVCLMAELKAYLPLLIALSANSPYWRGHETGFASYRQRILASSRSYGIPPDFLDWRAFEMFMATAIKAGMFASVHDIHWDIRPRPHLGTVEVRVMDAQATVSKAVALAAFVRMLIKFLQATREENRELRPCRSLHWWAEKDNCFNASRDGMAARVVNSDAGDVVPVRELIGRLFELLPEYASDDTERGCLDRLIATAQHPPYQRQLEVGAKKGLEDVVGALTEDLLAEASG